MSEIKENSQITLNIFNNQKETDKIKGQTENLSQENNSIPNMLQNFSSGINKEFPDNIRTTEYRRTDFPIREQDIRISNSLNDYNNNINNIQPEFTMQQANINSRKNYSDTKENEKKYCCGKCTKTGCYIMIVIISIIVVANLATMIMAIARAI